MIVVVGVPGVRAEGERVPDGLAAEIALAAAEAGAEVELVGRVGDDDLGDALLLALSSAGVGHAAVLRDPSRATPTRGSDPVEAPDSLLADDEPAPAVPPTDARPTLDAADLELGLRYLSDYRVLVLADPLPAAALRACAEAAAFSGAQLIVLAPEPPSGDSLPPAATVLQTPPGDDGAFARLVAAYAVALDRGETAEAAFQAAVAGTGWEPAAE